MTMTMTMTMAMTTVMSLATLLILTTCLMCIAAVFTFILIKRIIIHYDGVYSFATNSIIFNTKANL